MRINLHISIFSGKPDKRDLDGATAMHLGAAYGHLNIVTYLSHYGANLWAIDDRRRSIIDVAMAANHDDIAKFVDAEIGRHVSVP
jgi:glutaminase